MATPETFSETGSDATMYEKVCSQRPAERDVLTLRTAGDPATKTREAAGPARAVARERGRKGLQATLRSTQHNVARRDRRILYTRSFTPGRGLPGKRIWRYTTLPPRTRRNAAAGRHRRAQALAKLQSTRASLTDYAVELDKSADAKTGYKAKYADGKDYVLATYEKTKTQVNEYAVEPTTTYATETYAYVGDKFVSTKDYTYETYDSAKTYTYDTTLSLVENAKAMTEKMMLAMGSRKEAPETVAAEAEVMEA